MKRLHPALLAVLFAAVACSYTSTESLSCALDAVQPDTSADTTADEAEPADVPLPDFGEGVERMGSIPGTTGAACAKTSECADIPDAMCLTTVIAGVSFPGFTGEIPGGMCTKLNCDVTDAGACGQRGLCLDAAPVAGTAPGEMTLCVYPCGVDKHCRSEEGYGCYYQGVPGETRICLPADVIAIIDCGNGTCEPEINESPTTCPRDCL